MTPPKIKLLLLAALFTAPLASAALLYFVFPELIPGNRLNHGTLLEPARPLPSISLQDTDGLAVPDLALKGKWSLVILGEATCHEACRERLLLSRQVWLALDKHSRRVQRVYLAPDPAAAAVAQTALAAEHQDLLFLADTNAEAAAFFAPRGPQDLFLLDPLANWLLTYHGPLQHRELYRDLKRLLRFSQIG